MAIRGGLKAGLGYRVAGLETESQFEGPEGSISPFLFVCIVLAPIVIYIGLLFLCFRVLSFVFSGCRWQREQRGVQDDLGPW